MASPVIIDDGGSTRIKLVNSGFGSMNSLLNVDDTANPPHSDTETLNESYSSMTVLFVDAEGNSHQPALSPPALASGDVLVITSDNGQLVNFAVGGASSGVSVSGPANAAPLVEAKQHLRKRRYVVANAGYIKKIEINSGRKYSFSVPHGTLYTQVFLS